MNASFPKIEPSSPLPSVSSSLQSDAYSTKEQVRDWIVLTLYLITSIVAIIGNIFVCRVISIKPQMRSTTYILIINMAISDIIGGIVIPAQWLFCSTWFLDLGSYGPRICGIAKSSQVLSYYVSTFTMTAIAIDRYRLIVYPLKNRIRPLIPIVIIWVLGMLFTSPTFFSSRVSEYFTYTKGLISCRIIFQSEHRVKLRTVRAMIMMLMLVQYVIPLAITSYLYGMVLYTIWQRERIGTVSSAKKQVLDKSKRRTVKMLIIVVVLFAVSWFPTHLMHFFKVYTKIIPLPPKKCNASTFYMLCYWLSISSCMYNPFIYCYFNADFKNEAFRYWNAIVCDRLKIIPKEQSKKIESESYELNPTQTSMGE